MARTASSSPRPLSSAHDNVGVDYTVPCSRPAPFGWELADERMPESVLHDQAVALLEVRLPLAPITSGQLIGSERTPSSFSSPSLAVPAPLGAYLIATDDPAGGLDEQLDVAFLATPLAPMALRGGAP